MKLKSILAAISVAALLLTNGAFAQLEFQKSPNDHRLYRNFQLENEMEVLVISDPTTDTAAASMSLQVGGGSDYDSRPGIAHFTEHMMFIATEKYPAIDQFRAVVEKNGGSSNAYTGLEITNYNLSIDPDHLKPVLDRFAQFFIAPLFPEEFVDRERQVIDAEFEIRKQSDSGKAWSAMKSVFNPRHPASKFIAGNNESLAGDVRSDLVRFFEEFYSANLMTLVVLGREPLDVLEEWVFELFSMVKNTDAVKPESSEVLIEPSSLPALLKIKTKQDNPRLSIQFPIPTQRSNWRERPVAYVSNLIGHEGEGSLLSELKRSGWALGLVAAPGYSMYGSDHFNVSVSLTEKGVVEWPTVVQQIFAYIELIQQQGVNEWRFNEQKIIAEIDYRFSEPSSSSGYVSTLADLLREYPTNNLLPILSLIDRYDAVLIRQLLERLTPDNALVILYSPDAETNAVSPIYAADYALEQIVDQHLDVWRQPSPAASLHLPERNVFLPENLEMLADAGSEKPVKLASSPGFELWHQADTSFDVPRAGFYFSIRSPIIVGNIRNAVLRSLLVDAIEDQLTEFSYPAALAGLTFNLYGHSRGISVKIYGYSDNQEVMLQTIVNLLKNPKFEERLFERHRAEYIRDLKNSKTDDPTSRTITRLFSLVTVPFWTEDELLNIAESVTLEELKLFATEILKSTQVVALSHGNVSQQQALAMGDYVATELIDAEYIPTVERLRIINVPNTGPHLMRIPVAHEDSAVAVLVQATDQLIETRARFGLLLQMIRSPFFSELRTNQQLGYVVFATNLRMMDVAGLGFVVQSPNVLPSEMANRIEEFLDNFHLYVQNLANREFEEHKQSLVQALLEKETRLVQRTETYWNAIDIKDFEFNFYDRLAQVVSKVEREDFAEFVQTLFIGQNQRRMIIEGYGRTHQIAELKQPAEDVSLVKDHREFKQGLQYFSSI